MHDGARRRTLLTASPVASEDRRTRLAEPESHAARVAPMAWSIPRAALISFRPTRLRRQDSLTAPALIESIERSVVLRVSLSRAIGNFSLRATGIF